MKRLRHYSKDTAIVLSCFGSVESLHHYQNFHEQIKKEFLEHTIEMSFSSRTILKKLQRKDISFHTLPQILANIDRAGFRKVVVVSVNLFPTDEHEFVLKTVRGFEQFSLQRFETTKALLSRSKATSDFLVSLQDHFRKLHPQAAILYIAHGSPYLNQAGIFSLDYAKNFLKSLDNKTELCTLEGVYPCAAMLSQYQKQWKQQNIKKILIVSLLLVSGSHFNEDILEIVALLEKNFSVEIAQLEKEPFAVLPLPQTQKIVKDEINLALKKIH